MMGRAIMALVAKLGLTIVCGVIVTEEACALNAIELHEITYDMGTYHILTDAPSLKVSHFCKQIGLSGCKLHIIL